MWSAGEHRLALPFKWQYWPARDRELEDGGLNLHVVPVASLRGSLFRVWASGLERLLLQTSPDSFLKCCLINHTKRSVKELYSPTLRETPEEAAVLTIFVHLFFKTYLNFSKPIYWSPRYSKWSDVLDEGVVFLVVKNYCWCKRSYICFDLLPLHFWIDFPSAWIYSFSSQAWHCDVI